MGSPSHTFLEIENTPNRGDCLSHFGIAREVSALTTGKKITKEPISIKTVNEPVAASLKVALKDQKLCPQYMARVIKGVKIAASPKWLQDYLKTIGAKPINNVVDITNFIMHDLGQPLHAFDYSKIEGREIIVRTAAEGEKIVTLDGLNRSLKRDTLVIADMKKPIAIAGIMGGKNSEVTTQTVNIALESAEFAAKNIRKSSKKLGLSTEASYRYERGIDSANVEYS